jgi:hypothetical protein
VARGLGRLALAREQRFGRGARGLGFLGRLHEFGIDHDARGRVAQLLELVVGAGKLVAQIEGGQQHQARVARLPDLRHDLAHFLVDIAADAAHALLAPVVAHDGIVAAVDADDDLAHRL